MQDIDKKTCVKYVVSIIQEYYMLGRNMGRPAESSSAPWSTTTSTAIPTTISLFTTGAMLHPTCVPREVSATRAAPLVRGLPYEANPHFFYCHIQVHNSALPNKAAMLNLQTIQLSFKILNINQHVFCFIKDGLLINSKACSKFTDKPTVQMLLKHLNKMNLIYWKQKWIENVFLLARVIPARMYRKNSLITSLFVSQLLTDQIYYHPPLPPKIQYLPRHMAHLSSKFCSNPSRNLKPSSIANGINLEHNATDFPSNNSTLYPLILAITSIRESSCDNDDLSLCEENEPSKIINVTTEESSIPLPPNQIQEPIGEDSDRRSSISSLTSVTSRGSMSIMSPAESAAGNGAAATTRMGSLKGRISGALSYWTSPKNEKSPSQDKPSATATPNPSPSEPGDDIPMSPSSSSLLGGSIEEAFPGELENQPPLPMQSPPEKFAALNSSECGLPLHLFTKGNLVHPYLSLQYLDVLNSPSTRGFIVGASNALFIHKKNLYDVLVQVEDGKIEISDPELRKQLSLSTEDLRFSENIVRQVEAVNATLGNKSGSNGISGSNTGHPDVFLEGIGWVGGEEWLRYQFKVYLMSLLRSSFYPDDNQSYKM
ncbi:unnamed protein product, partial [Meganyctiphanes norvegica]